MTILKAAALAAVMLTTRVQAAPMETRADITSVDAENRTFDIMWSTGAKVLRSSYYSGEFYEELSMDPAHVRMGRLQSGTAPFLLNHDRSDVAQQPGVIESASIKGKAGFARVRMVKKGVDPVADMYFEKVVDKIVRNVSVGYRTFKAEKTDGVDTKIPTIRAVDWEPNEISGVTIGAEQGAGIRSVPAETNECELISTRAIPAPNPKEGNKVEKTPAELEAERQAELTAAGIRAVTADRARSSAIMQATRALPASIREAFADKLMKDDKISADKAREMVLEELARASDSTTEQATHTPVTGGETNDEKFIRGASAWLIEKSGQKVIEKAHELAQTGKLGGNFRHAEAFKKIELDGGEFRGLTLYELAKLSLERRGVKTQGLSRTQLVGMALTHRASAYAPASDFAVLYENVMNKTLLAAYATQPDLWSKFCKTDTVPDFRPSNRFRVGSFGALDVVPAGTEYKNKAIPDGEKTTITTETKGNIIALSREAIINDDMSANVDVAARFGRGARLGIEIEVFNLLAANSGLGPTQTDGQPFFHSANRGNVGAGETISVAALDRNYQVMQAHKDAQSNEYLNIKPKFLLVGSALRMTANRLNTAEFDNDGTQLMMPNGVRGMFSEVIDSPRIANPIRYLLADPSIAPAIVVAFLEGSGEAPMLEQKEGWRIDGIEWKARMDFLAQMFDPKGAVYDDGAT